MILPGVVGHTLFEPTFFILLLTQVIDPILAWMELIKESLDLYKPIRLECNLSTKADCWLLTSLASLRYIFCLKLPAG